MVDIGITPIPKIEAGNQSDLVLHSPLPHDLRNFSDNILSDAEIRSKIYDPLVASCPR